MFRGNSKCRLVLHLCCIVSRPLGLFLFLWSSKNKSYKLYEVLFIFSFCCSINIFLNICSGELFSVKPYTCRTRGRGDRTIRFLCDLEEFLL